MYYFSLIYCLLYGYLLLFFVIYFWCYNNVKLFACSNFYTNVYIQSSPCLWSVLFVLVSLWPSCFLIIILFNLLFYSCFCRSGDTPVPYAGGNISFNLLSQYPVPRPGHLDFYRTPLLYEFAKATAIRLTFRGHFYAENPRHQYYGVSDLVVSGRYGNKRVNNVSVTRLIENPEGRNIWSEFYSQKGGAPLVCVKVSNPSS